MRLRIAILSRTVGSYSAQRLKEACLRHGHEVRLLNPLNFSLLVETGSPMLSYRERPLAEYDAVIPRIGASVSAYGTAVVRQFELMGIFTLNSAQAIAASRDKLRALQALSANGIAVPTTAFVRDRLGIRHAVDQVGGAPVVIKLLEGSQGVGVMLADTKPAAEAILETLVLSRQSAIVQKFVGESRGRDLRALVVGGRVVAAMERRAATPDEFRSNLHRGANTFRTRLSAELESIAVRATQIMGLRVAGVDLIESDAGPLVLEVNSSPGLEGIEGATEIDVAEHITRHLEDQVRFRAFDVAQRLTAAPGFGVLEVPVPRYTESALTGRSLKELGLEELGARVLTLTRKGEVVGNPPADTVIEPGDKLVCYGPCSVLEPLLGPEPERVFTPENQGEDAA